MMDAEFPCEQEKENFFLKYETIAVFILPNIRSNLLKTFEKYIKDQKPSLFIYNDTIKKINPNAKKKVTMESIIAACTYIALSKESLESALRTYRENRRVTKRNWFKQIAEEMASLEGGVNVMGPRNPLYLRTFAESSYNMQALDRHNTEKKSVEELMHESYQDVKKWKEDLAALITDFLFFAMKPINSVISGFIYDVTYESLKIIRDLYGGSIDGYNLKFPSELTEHPLFSYRSTKLTFELEFIENELLLLNHTHYDNEDITVSYQPGEELSSSIKKEKSQNQIKKMQINLQELDMVDRELITNLFNRINGDTFNTQFITGNLRELVQSTLGVKVPKKKHYDNVMARLDKLRGYNYQITVKSKDTGEIVESTSIGLINYVHYNKEENFFQFTPSEQWIQTYIQKKYTSILANSYKTIDSHQTKGVMMILQKERLTEYIKNSSEIVLPLTYFRSHLKLIRIGNAMLVKELNNHLCTLKTEKIVVEDFEFINKNSSIHITFTQLNPVEMLAYGFSDRKMLEAEDKNIIDIKEYSIDSAQDDKQVR